MSVDGARAYGPLRIMRKRPFLRKETLTLTVAIVGLVIAPTVMAEQVNGGVGATRSWRIAVTNICTGALLFDGRHSIGTAEGAQSVARDIRASTQRRIARIKALSQPPQRPLLASRWLATERTLSLVYARSYLDIWRAIAHADTPVERAELPRAIRVLLHRPDVISARARRQAAQLRVPDCTGGNRATTDPLTP
jgi:hypothetical protein